MVLNLCFKLKASICSFLKFRLQMPSNCDLHHNEVFMVHSHLTALLVKSPWWLELWINREAEDGNVMFLAAFLIEYRSWDWELSRENSFRSLM